MASIELQFIQRGYNSTALFQAEQRVQYTYEPLTTYHETDYLSHIKIPTARINT
jgi:hypothetical protein